jgi:hypothetical protein
MVTIRFASTLLFAFALTSIAHADNNAFSFSGTATYVDPLLNSIANPGNPINGIYTFDPKVPDTQPLDPTFGAYSSATAYSVSIGSFSEKANPVIFNIFNNLVIGQFYRTQYRAVLSQPATDLFVNGLKYVGFSLDLWSVSTTPLSIFTSDALPIVPPSISVFDNKQLRFYFLDSDNGVHYIIGDLNSLTVVLDHPPIISGMPSPGCTMWPPNHKLVQVAIVTATAADPLSGLAPGSFKVIGTSNDPANGQIVITGGANQYTVQLGADKGQIYMLTATASDLAGNTTTKQATCIVPHDQGK